MSAGREPSSTPGKENPGWQSVTINEGRFASISSMGDIEDGRIPDSAKISLSAHSGLSGKPHILHAQHLSSIPHLAEVQELHSRFLVSAGELPESHLAEILPDRRLEWMVAELGGNLGERRISIPLRGTTLGRVEVSKGELHGHPVLKLNLLDIGWHKTVTLPDDARELTAVWDSGELHIGW